MTAKTTAVSTVNDAMSSPNLIQFDPRTPENRPGEITYKSVSLNQNQTSHISGQRRSAIWEINVWVSSEMTAIKYKTSQQFLAGVISNFAKSDHWQKCAVRSFGLLRLRVVASYVRYKTANDDHTAITRSIDHSRLQTELVGVISNMQRLSNSDTDDSSE